MEEWPCRGKALEGHDKSSPILCGPVALSKSLKWPSSKTAQSVPPPFPFPPRSQHQPLIPCPRHRSPPPWTQRWAVDHVSSLCSQAALISPPSITPHEPTLRFHLSVQFWSQLDSFISICLNLKKSLWCLHPLVPSFLLYIYIFFKIAPQSVFHCFSHSCSLTSAQYLLLPLNTNYQPKIEQTDSQHICGSKMDSVRAWVWMSLTRGTPCSGHVSDVAIRSLPLCSLQLHRSSAPIKTPEKSGNQHR